MLGDIAQHGVGQDGGAQHVAHKSGQAGSGACCILRCQVKCLHADEHHGTVDEKTDGDQTTDDDAQVGHVLPVDADGHDDQGHENHGGKRTTAVEYLIAQPAAEDGAGDGSDLIGKVGPTGILDVNALLAQDGGSPVQAAVAHHVDEGVGQCDVPQELVGEHSAEDFLHAERLFALLLVIVLGSAAAPLLDRGQAARLRGVTDEHIGDNRNQDGHGGGEGIGADQEVHLLVVAIEP